ncbi:hypothetical protein [Roseibium sp. M-1]
MTLSRRHLLELSLAGAAGLAAGAGAALAAQQSAAPVADRLLLDFADHFHARGYAVIDALPLITGDGFNGGLRYDDSRMEALGGKSVFIQPAARTADMTHRGEPGVLALFTICGLHHPAPAEPGQLFGALLTFLVERAGIDPEKLVFVSTEVFAPYGETHDAVRAGKLLLRPRSEAMADGEGSGYFSPAEHPAKPAFDTVSLHYPLTGLTAPGVETPLDGYAEIAEIGITALDGAETGPETGGFGLERLVMAGGGPVPDFEASREKLLRLIEQEAERDGKDLPPGYHVFAGE